MPTAIFCDNKSAQKLDLVLTRPWNSNNPFFQSRESTPTLFMSDNSDDTSQGGMREVFRSQNVVGIEWTPIHYQLSRNQEESCTSPEIRALASTWSLMLFPNGINFPCRAWIGLAIFRRGPRERDVLFRVCVKLAGETEREIESMRLFPPQNFSYQIFKLLPRSSLEKGGSILNLTGQLTITFEIWGKERRILEVKKFASRETQTEEQSDNTAREENGANLDTKVDPTLQKHLKDFLLSGDDHDVTIKVGNQEFKAHKCILRARSPVFAAMFKHEMKESEDNSITIDDCDPDAFGEFLSYVYTGKVDDLSPRKAIGLYYAGDKYDFSGLKEVCVQFLEASLSKTSVCDVINLATRHSEKGLLDSAIKFFSENTKEILITVEWQRFAANNFAVSNELILKAIDAIGKKK